MGEKVSKEYVSGKDLLEYFSDLFYEGLEKDLVSTEEYTEEICHECRGTGIVIRDNRFGLSDEKPKFGILFPYKNQGLTFCPKCYNGAVKRCNRCGELMPRHLLRHDCKAQKEITARKEEEERRKKIMSIPWATEEQAAENRMFFSEYFSGNEGYFEDWDEFFDDWEENHDPSEAMPLFCFGTDIIRFRIDAEQAVENACDNAGYEYIDYDGLQKIVDEWTAENGPGDTYVYHERYKIRIPWEKRKNT